MKRRLVPIYAATCLLMAIVLTALWMVSYRNEPAFKWGDAGRLTASRGVLLLQSPLRNRNAQFHAKAYGWGVLGFSWIGSEMIEPNISIPAVRNNRANSYVGDPVSHYRDRNPPLVLCGAVSTPTGTDFVVLGWELGLPLWFLVTGALIAPAIWYGRHIHQRRLASIGHCRTCGYDLRASIDRCPECGTLFIRKRGRILKVAA